jgi:hypothetical protein
MFCYIYTGAHSSAPAERFLHTLGENTTPDGGSAPFPPTHVKGAEGPRGLEHNPGNALSLSLEPPYFPGKETMGDGEGDVNFGDGAG